MVTENLLKNIWFRAKFIKMDFVYINKKVEGSCLSFQKLLFPKQKKKRGLRCGVEDIITDRVPPMCNL